MGGFSDGDVVWGPGTKQGTSMWPAVVVEARVPDEPTKCIICFILRHHKNLDDILASRKFSKERNSLCLFEPRSVSKFVPDAGNGNQTSLLRNQFDEVLALTTQLYETRKKQVQEEYQRLVEKATQRSAIADANEPPPTIELAAGAHIFFWIPGMIAGREESEMYARVLTVHHPSRYSESQIPLELDSGHVLTMDDSVKMLKPIETKSMPLRKYKLKTSSVNGVRIADMICQSVQDRIDTLKAENPAYAHMFRDPFGNTRKVEVGKQEAKDADYTPKPKKKPKKKVDPSPKREQTPKRHDVPAERPGWKPNCDDSEEEEENRMKFLPQLTVPNRPQSQKSLNRSNLDSSTTPSRPKSKPNVSDSDADDQDFNATRKQSGSLTQTPKSLSSKRLKSKPEVSECEEDGQFQDAPRKGLGSLKKAPKPFSQSPSLSQSRFSDRDFYGSSSGSKTVNAKSVTSAADSEKKRRKFNKWSRIPKISKERSPNPITKYFSPERKDDNDVRSPCPKQAKVETIEHDLTQSASEESDCKERNREMSQLSLKMGPAKVTEKVDDSKLNAKPEIALSRRRRRSSSRGPRMSSKSSFRASTHNSENCKCKLPISNGFNAAEDDV